MDFQSSASPDSRTVHCRNGQLAPMRMRKSLKEQRAPSETIQATLRLSSSSIEAWGFHLTHKIRKLRPASMGEHGLVAGTTEGFHARVQQVWCRTGGKLKKGPKLEPHQGK